MAEIVARHDPIGLLAAGAPADEYEPEVGSLVPRLAEAATAAELLRIVHEELVRWFGDRLAGPAERHTALADDLWSRWLVARARQLAGEDDVELVDTAQVRVRYGEQVMEPARVLRVGARYFVEMRGSPEAWWMGEGGSGGEIAVWGQYGTHEEAFGQH